MASGSSTIGCRRSVDTTRAMAKKLYEWNRQAENKGLVIESLEMDNEAASVDMSGFPHLALTTAGKHCVVAERKIRTLKERLRVLVAKCSRELVALYYMEALDWITRSVNFIPHSATPNAPSPFEQYTGTRLDARRHLRASFLDVVQDV